MTTIAQNQPRVTAAKAAALTTNQVAAVFGVSIVTISVWRKGTPTRDKLKTCHNEDKSRFPRFRVGEVLRYAKKHGLELAREPHDVLATWVDVKPGPKPKSETEGFNKGRALTPVERRLVGTKLEEKTSKSAKKKPKH